MINNCKIILNILGTDCIYIHVLDKIFAINMFSAKLQSFVISLIFFSLIYKKKIL